MEKYTLAQVADGTPIATLIFCAVVFVVEVLYMIWGYRKGAPIETALVAIKMSLLTFGVVGVFLVSAYLAGSVVELVHFDEAIASVLATWVFVRYSSRIMRYTRPVKVALPEAETDYFSEPTSKQQRG